MEIADLLSIIFEFACHSARDVTVLVNAFNLTELQKTQIMMHNDDVKRDIFLELIDERAFSKKFYLERFISDINVYAVERDGFPPASVYILAQCYNIGGALERDFDLSHHVIATEDEFTVGETFDDSGEFYYCEENDSRVYRMFKADDPEVFEEYDYRYDAIADFATQIVNGIPVVLYAVITNPDFGTKMYMRIARCDKLNEFGGTRHDDCLFSWVIGY